MNVSMKKYARKLGSFVWFFIVISGFGFIFNIYHFYNCFYDQTRQELVQKMSAHNDPLFEQWIKARIIEQHPDGPIPLISISDYHPAHGAALFDAEVFLFFIRGEGKPNQGLVQKVKTAEHAYTLCIPLKYQMAVLQHLEAQHMCSDACAQALHQFTAALDHEYAHVRNQDQLTRLKYSIFGMGVLDLISLSIALTGLYYGYPLVYAFTPLIGRYVCFTALVNGVSRHFEYQADEAIRDNATTLNAWCSWLESCNLRFEERLQSEPNGLFRLSMLSAHGDGFWAKNLFGTHPTINARIARAQERLEALQA